MIQLTLHRDDGATLFIDIDPHKGCAYLNARYPWPLEKLPATVATFSAQQTADYARRWHEQQIDELFGVGEIPRIQHVGR